MAQLSIGLIGPFQAEIDSQAIAGFKSNKVRALLAILAAEPDHPHSRDRLAGMLWPDYPNPTALAYLRNALSNLRKVIGDRKANPPYLIVTQEAFQINRASSLWVDLYAFDESTGKSGDSPPSIHVLQSAVALYRGSFMDGFTCDSSVFEDWALARREQLNRDLCAALSRLAGAYIGSEEYALAVQTARRLLELEPWDENAHCLLMRGLAYSGQRGAALAQYETCRRVLREELGVEPDAETRAVVESIRAGQLAPAIGTSIPVELSRSRAPARLPEPLTSFVGRQSELREIRRLMGHPLDGEQLAEGKARLLTLSGSGGCGKTRLAIATARSLVEAGYYPHGARWVDLSAVADAGLVPITAASAFGLAESANSPALQLLENYLRERELLLVLDNCEHLVEATARLVEALLNVCPGLQVLVTSREPLGIGGEVVWRVPSMSLPEVSAGTEEMSQCDAMRLFEERARAASPGWQIKENAARVAAICARLDGIPLAIELAAARVRMMGMEQIGARLGDAFKLLTGGSRTALLRHQTLRACIDWSYQLLSPAEQVLLRQLAVFNGGWTLEAAESVGQVASVQATDKEEVIDVLAHLVDRSLVVVSRVKGQVLRYRLLDTIHQYAREKLVEAGEVEGACRRHLAYFKDLAVRAEGQLRGPEQVAWHGVLGAELDNLRAALEWALKADVQSGLRIAAALFWFWRRRVDWRAEGLQWLERGLAVDETLRRADTQSDFEHAQNRGWALNCAGWLLRDLLMVEVGGMIFSTQLQRREGEKKLFAYKEEALVLFSGMGKLGRRGFAFANQMIGRIETDVQRVKAILEESLAIFRKEGDKFWSAECLNSLASLERDAKDYERAQILHDEELVLRREIGDLDGLGWVYLLMGILAFEQSQYSLAQQRMQESLGFYRTIGFQELIFRATGVMIDLAIAQNDLARALSYSESMLEIAQDTGENWQLGYALLKRGDVIYREDPSEARSMLKDALFIFRKINIDWGKYYTLEILSYQAIAEGEPLRAARLLGASGYWTKRYLGEGVLLWQLPRRETYLTQLQSAMGEQAFTKAFQEGEAMTIDQAVDYALEET